MMIDTAGADMRGGMGKAGRFNRRMRRRPANIRIA
jgi:hypothetical protein